MCKCCFTTTTGLRQYTNDFEPAAAQPFDDLWERKLTSVQQVKGISNARHSFVFLRIIACIQCVRDSDHISRIPFELFVQCIKIEVENMIKKSPQFIEH